MSITKFPTTEDQAKEGLMTCEFAGKWQQAKDSANPRFPHYWNRVRLAFLEYGGWAECQRHNNGNTPLTQQQLEELGIPNDAPNKALDDLQAFNEKHGEGWREQIREGVIDVQDPVVATLFRSQFRELFNASSKKQKARLTDRFPDLWADRFLFTESDVAQLRRLANDFNAAPEYKQTVADLFGTVDLTADMSFFDSLMPKASDCVEKPVIGLEPKWLWQESRMHEIMDAIQRYKAAGKAIPGEWMVELSSLLTNWCYINCPVQGTSAS